MTVTNHDPQPIAPVQPGRFAHWSLRYFMNKFRVALYEWRHSNAPWLTPQATEFLENWLRPDDSGLEWGSGRSTLWFAERVARFVSVENEKVWFERISAQIAGRGISNVDYRLVDQSAGSASHVDRYVHIVDDIAPGSLDFVLVDDLHRAECAMMAIRLLKHGGLLILDNANWFYPHQSQSPNSVGTKAPPSDWIPVVDILRTWRMYWTSSGVWDTALFFKP